MNTWILVFILFRGPDSMSLDMQEFNSETTCKSAITEIEKLSMGTRVRLLCVKK